MTEFKKHRGRHKFASDDTGIVSCVKCGKPVSPNSPKPETVIPPNMKVE